MTIEEILVKLVQATLNISQDDFTALVKNGEEFKPEAVDLLSAEFAKKYKAIEDAKKDDYEKSKQNLINKAVKETTDKWVKPIEKVFGLTVDVEKADVFEQTVSQALEEVRGSGKMKEEDVLKHPSVIELKNNLITNAATEKEEAVSAVKSEFDKFKQDAEYNTTVSKVKERINDFWSKNEQNIIQMDDAPRKKLRDVYTNELLSAGKYKLADDGGVQLLDDEGNILTDDLKNPVKFEDLIVSKFNSELPLKPASERSSTGSGSKSDGGGGTTLKPKTDVEMNKIINDKDVSVEDKNKAMAYYEEQSK